MPNLANVDETILSIFTQYAQDYANARQVVQNALFGNIPTFLQVDVPDTASRQMQMIYSPPSAPQQGGSPGGVSPNFTNLPQPQLPDPTQTTTQSLTFDISLNVPGLNGIPQQITYTERARSSIEQTAVGYHVNAFAMATGSLDIDAIITFRGVAFAQVQAFFGFLQMLNVSTNPLLVTNPGLLIFIDAYLQRCLAIYLQSVTLSEVAGANDQAHITLSAAILQDYNQGTSDTGVSVNTPPGSITNANALLNDILQFVGTTFP